MGFDLYRRYLLPFFKAAVAFSRGLKKGSRYLTLLLLLGCSVSPNIQPHINSLVIAKRFDYALDLFEQHKEAYGPKNHLLYLMDYAMVLHLAKQYDESIKIFERAKDQFDALFTVSLSNQAATWLINDNTAPYRGEDFERVMINVIQALNFAALGDFNGALVEARDVDIRLSLINRQYPPEEQSVYKEDALARMLMGVLYEAAGADSDLNDAFISNQKALQAYEREGSLFADLGIPSILKENLLTTAAWMNDPSFDSLRQRFKDTDFVSVKDKKKKAQIICVHYEGLSPIKHQVNIPIPLPGPYYAKMAFPRYSERGEPAALLEFRAQGKDSLYQAVTEDVQDIGALAIDSLESRQKRVIAKAALRSAGKHMIARTQEAKIEEKHGEGAATAFKYLSSIYNITSEQADLRSWQTLPDRIRMARLIVEPGIYELGLGDKNLGSIEAKAGEVKFVLVK